MPGVYGEDLSSEEKSKLALNEKQLAFYQSAFLSETARQAGIRANDIILGVDNKPLEILRGYLGVLGGTKGLIWNR